MGKYYVWESVASSRRGGVLMIVPGTCRMYKRGEARISLSDLAKIGCVKGNEPLMVGIDRRNRAILIRKCNSSNDPAAFIPRPEGAVVRVSLIGPCKAMGFVTNDPVSASVEHVGDMLALVLPAESVPSR